MVAIYESKYAWQYVRTEDPIVLTKEQKVEMLEQCLHSLTTEANLDPFTFEYWKAVVPATVETAEDRLTITINHLVAALVLYKR